MAGRAVAAPARGMGGMAYGLLGVLGFSLTLPATRVAVAYLDPTLVGLGRALVAAVLAGVVLLVTRAPRPTGGQWRRLIVVALGVILGFPLLSAWAMTHLPAAHGAIVLGVLPLATALAGAVRSHEQPSAGFWLASLAGSAVVIGFSLSQGAGRLDGADLVLLAAVAAAAVGYAEGGRLAVELGGAPVICWALLLAAPFLVLPVGWAVAAHGWQAPPQAWIAFAYVSLISQLLAFFAWYRGLALGGVARVSQLQLLQPFLTVVLAALLLGETVTWTMLGAAVLVVITIVLGRRTGVRRKAQAV